MSSSPWILICWGFFGTAWIAGMVYNFFRAPAVSQIRFRFDWIIIIALIWLIERFVPQEIWPLLTFDSELMKITGAICLTIATGFTLWARWVLGKMWSLIAAVKKGHKLLKNGPYRFTRHPIYTGIFGMLLGTMLHEGFGKWIVYFIVSFIVLLNRILAEEQMMIETFGEQYITYMQHVPRLIPALLKKKK